MRKHTKRLAGLLTLAMLCGCGEAAAPVQTTDTAETPESTDTAVTEVTAVPQAELTELYPEARVLELDSAAAADGEYSHSAMLDGAALEEFDYVWHADPSEGHDEVKNCPAEYYTGTAPDTDAAAYIAHDLKYYPELELSGFQRLSYDGEQEWCYSYTAEGWQDYLFATLPVLGSDVPAEMMHSEAEAYENAVLHITQPGTYILSGVWHGQIWVELDAVEDETARVTLVLNGADITCTAAPAIVFYSVYECDSGWEDREQATADVDTADAGAVVVLADGTVNNVTGANVYRMLKAVYKNAEDTSPVPVQKKARKIDGALYSYMSMNIEGGPAGTGVLNVVSTTYEGLDSELHLTINGGNVNIYSQDDGINVNEDGVSVVTVNGGSVHILAGLGSEGDGIDSNGFVVINGGTVVSAANPNSDSGLDSDAGTYIHGGTVLALGSTMDGASADERGEGQAAMNLRFARRQEADTAITVMNADGEIVFAYDPAEDEVAGTRRRPYQGAILSAPGICVGETYSIYAGGSLTGTETGGVYVPETVTGLSGDARLQGYTGSGEFGRFGGMGGMERPEGGTAPGGMQPPENQPPQDGQRFPEGMTSPDAMQRPDGMQRPGGMEPPQGGFDRGGMENGQRPNDMDGMQRPGENTPDGSMQTEFAVSARACSFSGVQDAPADKAE